MYLLVLFLPLISSINSFFLTRFITKKGTSFISNLLMVLATMISWFIFYDTALSHTVTYIKAEYNYALILHTGSIPFSLVFDTLTCVMLVVVVTVSTLVHIFGYKYMEHDPRLNIFFCYISLFTFFMLILVCTNSFFHMFFGWEGVGLCSYLLINFWYTRLQANKAAIKAMLVNRIGDMALTLAILLIYFIFKSLNYGTVFALAPYFQDLNFVFLSFEVKAYTVISILLFIGAVGKSAQIGLHTWLPDAMEGPTPVSALIHAATMVTAGVFLLARCSPIIEYSEVSLAIITLFGAATSFFAATTGLFQNDLKKVIAYSTCSQLGYMVFACGLSNYSVGIFHLANHAFFKALLFLTAGCIIHALSDEQDMRRMGGLSKLLPFSYSMIFIGSLALAGFPFLTGFYSKDVILEISNVKYTVSSQFANWLGTLAAFFTAFYSTRLICLTFLNKTNVFLPVMKHVHDAPILMAIPLMILALGSIFVGYIFKDMIIGLGTDFWGNSLFVLPEHLILVDAEFLPVGIKLIPFFLTILAIGSASLFYNSIFLNNLFFDYKVSPFGRKVYLFFNKKWLFDRFYNSVINQNILSYSYNVVYKLIDKGVVEHLGPQGLYSGLRHASKRIAGIQTGFITQYTFLVYISLLILFFIFLDSFYSCFFLYIILFTFLHLN